MACVFFGMNIHRAATTAVAATIALVTGFLSK
jgi:hypothetical protein